MSLYKMVELFAKLDSYEGWAYENDLSSVYKVISCKCDPSLVNIINIINFCVSSGNRFSPLYYMISFELRPTSIFTNVCADSVYKYNNEASNNTFALIASNNSIPVSLEWQVVNCERATSWLINAKCSDFLTHSE